MTSHREQRLGAVQDLIEYFSQTYGNKDWFVLHEAMEIVGDADKGLSWKVTQPIDSGTTLMVIPETERISFRTLSPQIESPWPTTAATTTMSWRDMLGTMQEQTMERVDDEIPSHILLAAVLVLFVLANDNTRFDAVRNTWPSRQELRGQQVDGTADALRGTYSPRMLVTMAQAKERFLTEILQPTLNEYGVAHLFCKTDDTLQDAFEYALAIVNSRSHEGLPRAMTSEIVPLLDTVNGLPSESKGINVTMETHIIDGSVQQVGSSLRAKRDLEVGTELIVSYGACPPCMFLHKYGFLPDAYLEESSLMVDLVCLDMPPELLVDPDDESRILALQRGQFPTTLEELKNTPIFLTPDDLRTYRVGLNGLGDHQIGMQPNEPKDIRYLRQFIILAKVGDENLIQRHLETRRIKGDVESFAIGIYLLKVVDYNLEQLASDGTNAEEKKLLTEPDLSPKQKSCIRARMLSRDAMAQWRHCICRHYGIFSSADNSERLRSLFDEYLALPDPVSLHGGGCSVCGRTTNVRRCARCGEVKYCSKHHQLLHWRIHKPLCISVPPDD